MAYQSMAARDGTPLLREKGGVDVVDEGGSFDEVDGSRVETSSSRRGRKGAALSLLVLAVGAVSALSAIRGQSTPQSESNGFCRAWAVLVPPVCCVCAHRRCVITLISRGGRHTWEDSPSFLPLPTASCVGSELHSPVTAGAMHGLRNRLLAPLVCVAFACRALCATAVPHVCCYTTVCDVRQVSLRAPLRVKYYY